MGAHEMTYDSRGEAYVDAIRLGRGRSQAIPPWPDKEAHEAKYWVANETLAIYIFWQKCGTDVRRSFSSLRRATRAVSQLVDLSAGPLGWLAPSSVRVALRSIRV